MSPEYELLNEEHSDPAELESSPLLRIADEDSIYSGKSGASSPLSELMLGRAKQLSPRREDIISRRDALINAYKKLISAQQYKTAAPKYDQWVGGAAGMMMSGNPSVRAIGAGSMEQAKAFLSKEQREQEALKAQAMADLQMNNTNLGFLDKDQSSELELLKQASMNDYRQLMSQMKMALAAMKNDAAKKPKNSLSPDQETFRALGVPQYSGPDPYSGLDDTGKRQMRMNYEKQLSKDQEAVSSIQSSVDRMKRFQQLNESVKDNLIGTGPIAGYVPNLSDELIEMDSIASEITPQMRTPGSGASSDFDARMFQKATVGTNKDYEVNKNIAAAYIASKQNEMQKPDFLEAYLSANGHLRGAQQAWKKYLNENPIFDPSSKKFELNQKRKQQKI